MAGLLLVAIFDGVLLGTCFAPQIGLLFGFAEPQSLHDPYWESASVRASKIVALVLTLGAFATGVFGFARCKLIRHDTV